MNKENSNLDKNNFTFSPQRVREHRSIRKQILSKLTDALILFKMKTGHKGNYDVNSLRFNKEGKIVLPKNSENQKTPVDVLGNIAEINIIKTKKELFNSLDNEENINKKEKEIYKKSIENFIFSNFLKTRKELEKKKNRAHGKFRSFYSKFAKEKKLPEQEEKLYRDICITLANILYEKDKSLINPNGEINQKGLQVIGESFLRTISNLRNSGSSKSFHKVFHDGDFNFLRKENDNGKPTVGKLEHYVDIIKYLMDMNEFNPYAEGGEIGANERKKSKKSFLNNVFVASKLNKVIEKKISSNRRIIHNNLSSSWSQAINEFNLKDEENKKRIPTTRLKTETSIFQKASGRTNIIKDESGIRAIYYGEDNKENIGGEIIDIIRKYIKKIKKINGVKINKIELDRKGDFISEEEEQEIKEILKRETDCTNIQLREKKQSKKDNKLQSITGKYKNLTNNHPDKGLKEAYNIANNNKRGSNGEYKDFKLIVAYSIDQDEYNSYLENSKTELNKSFDLSQEISFYPHKNDLNIGNHHFLDLEKKIFMKVKNTNDSDTGKSISLNKVRYFTETALKNISFDIDIFEDKIKRGILPKPQNDDYAYLNIDGEKISLKNLLYRNKENDKRFDKLISNVINYFIKNNKILYLNKENSVHYGLVNPNMLKNKLNFKEKRFTTTDVIRNTALDAKNSNNSISFYTKEKNERLNSNFYNVNLGNLGDFIELENNNRK